MKEEAATEAVKEEEAVEAEEMAEEKEMEEHVRVEVAATQWWRRRTEL